MNTLHVTVGHQKGQFTGQTHRPIQAAVDFVARHGGGTVEVLEGTFRLGNAVHLSDGVRLIGQGDRTRLVKNQSVTTTLIEDTDWYDRRAVVADPTGFEIGGGLLLNANHAHGQGRSFTKHTVLAIDGNTLHFAPAPHNQPRANFWTTHDATASTLFPIVTANWSRDIVIENLVIDGNRADNAHLDGNYGGCIFLQDCQNVRIAGVRAENNNGDGISWQVCDDVHVEECVSVGHAGLGLHPGSGSQRPVIRRNVVRDCRIGLFWCWGVKFGLAVENDIRDINGPGISTGHRDTDNVMRRNLVDGCDHAGLLFRNDDPSARCAHRNVVEDNIFRNTGRKESTRIGINARRSRASC